MGGNAVLERETGLVWDRTPDHQGQSEWLDGTQLCWTNPIAGRHGWRLPTVDELMTLFDATNVNPEPSLPDGHPFIGSVDADGYWSSTDYPGSQTFAYYVDFVGASPGQGGTRAQVASKTGTLLYRGWCVRGGAGDDVD